MGVGRSSSLKTNGIHSEEKYDDIESLWLLHGWGGGTQVSKLTQWGGGGE